MSLMSGIGAGIGSLGTYAGKAMTDLALEDRTPLLSRPAAPVVATEPTPAAPAAALEPTAGSNSGSVDDATAARAKLVVEGLVARGMKPADAIGFAANAVKESGANPQTGAGDAGASHGLLQWNGDRLAGYVQKFGHAPEHGTLDENLDFIMHELSGPEASAWKMIQAAPDDPMARAAAISQHYERPKDTANEIARRSLIANQLASRFGVI
jgi:hypothetical protein